MLGEGLFRRLAIVASGGDKGRVTAMLPVITVRMLMCVLVIPMGMRMAVPVTMIIGAV